MSERPAWTIKGFDKDAVLYRGIGRDIDQSVVHLYADQDLIYHKTPIARAQEHFESRQLNEERQQDARSDVLI